MRRWDDRPIRDRWCQNTETISKLKRITMWVPEVYWISENQDKKIERESQSQTSIMISGSKTYLELLLHEKKDMHHDCLKLTPQYLREI